MLLYIKCQKKKKLYSLRFIKCIILCYGCCDLRLQLVLDFSSHTALIEEQDDNHENCDGNNNYYNDGGCAQAIYTFVNQTS